MKKIILCLITITTLCVADSNCSKDVTNTNIVEPNREIGKYTLYVRYNDYVTEKGTIITENEPVQAYSNPNWLEQNRINDGVVRKICGVAIVNNNKVK